jgi:hypothetical protein
MANKTGKGKLFWHSPLGLFLVAVASFGLAFLVFLRASDTGSLQQYAIMFILIFFGLNRLVRVIRVGGRIVSE